MPSWVKQIKKKMKRKKKEKKREKQDKKREKPKKKRWNTKQKKKENSTKSRKRENSSKGATKENNNKRQVDWRSHWAGCNILLQFLWQDVCRERRGAVDWMWHLVSCWMHWSARVRHPWWKHGLHVYHLCKPGGFRHTRPIRKRQLVYFIVAIDFLMN